MVGAPDGWMLNEQLARQFNVAVAICAKDQETWPGVLLYVASVPKGPQCPSLAEYLNTYRSQLERPGTKVTATKQRDLKGELGATAQVYFYSGLATQRSEANAFFENKDSVDMIVMSAPNEELFRKALPVFGAVARTYGNTALKPKEEPVEPADAGDGADAPEVRAATTPASSPAAARAAKPTPTPRATPRPRRQ